MPKSTIRDHRDHKKNDKKQDKDEDKSGFKGRVRDHRNH